MWGRDGARPASSGHPAPGAQARGAIRPAVNARATTCVVERASSLATALRRWVPSVWVLRSARRPRPWRRWRPRCRTGWTAGTGPRGATRGRDARSGSGRPSGRRAASACARLAVAAGLALLLPMRPARLRPGWGADTFGSSPGPACHTATRRRGRRSGPPPRSPQRLAVSHPSWLRPSCGLYRVVRPSAALPVRKWPEWAMHRPGAG